MSTLKTENSRLQSVAALREHRWEGQIYPSPVLQTPTLDQRSLTESHVHTMSSPPITRQIESPATYFGAGISGGDPEDLSTVNRVRSDTSNVIVRIVSCPSSSTSSSSPTVVATSSSSAHSVKRKSTSAVDCLQTTINKLQKRVSHIPTLAFPPSTSSASTMAPEYDNSDDSDVPLIVDETTPPTSPAPAAQQPPTPTPPLAGPPALLPHYDVNPPWLQPHAHHVPRGCQDHRRHPCQLHWVASSEPQPPHSS